MKKLILSLFVLATFTASCTTESVEEELNNNGIEAQATGHGDSINSGGSGDPDDNDDNGEG